MKRIEKSNRFVRQYQRMIKRGKNEKKFEEVLILLVEGKSIPEKYRDHKLKGEFKDFRDLHIEPDWVLIYRINEEVVILEGTGTHADLF